jgi:RNA polymerase sigma-70 factor (ECF subfamily)
MALVSRLNAGEREAFDVLYGRYRDWVYSLAYRVCRNDEIAADTVQEVFVYFLGKFPGFELRARLTTFLYPVVRNTAITLSKKRRRAVPTVSGLGDEGVFAALTGDGEGSGGGVGGDRELRAALVRAVSGLSVAHREVLLMRFVDGMSVSEVSAAVGVPEGTVKSRLYHAVRLVRRERGLRAWTGAEDTEGSGGPGGLGEEVAREGESG